MIPSSFNTLSISLFLLVSLSVTSMERTPSGVVHKPAAAPLLQSQSMAFPPRKKDNSGQGQGSLRGSIIRGIHRTTSILSIGRHSSSGEVAPEAPPTTSTAIPAAAQPIISAPLTTATLKAATPVVTEKKELIFGKYIYSVKYGGKPTTVRLEGPCTTQYLVNSLSDFKSSNAHLKRKEVLEFIDKNLQKYNKSLSAGNLMIPHQRDLAAKEALKLIKKYKDKPEFTTLFYLIRSAGDSRICAFASELEEIKNN